MKPSRALFHSILFFGTYLQLSRWCAPKMRFAEDCLLDSK